jgi:phage antirepressor YoqD-like protein
MGPKAVQGAVKNNSTETADAEIKVDFYDAFENMLGSVVGIVKDINPGETKLFDIWAERLPDMYEIEEHKIDYLKKV